MFRIAGGLDGVRSWRPTTNPSGVHQYRNNALRWLSATMLLHLGVAVGCCNMNTRVVYEVRRGGDVGAAVAAARRDRGLTQAELAEQLGIDRGYLAAIETGRTNRLIEHLLRALRRLGADVTVTWPAAPSAGASRVDR